MRFIHLFLIGYFVLIVGVSLALWQTGVLSRVAPISRLTVICICVSPARMTWSTTP